MPSSKREKESILIAQNKENKEMMPDDTKGAPCNQETDKTAIMAQLLSKTPIKTAHVMETFVTTTPSLTPITITKTTLAPMDTTTITDSESSSETGIVAKAASGSMKNIVLANTTMSTPSTVATLEVPQLSSLSSSPPISSSSLSLSLSTPSSLASSISQTRLPAQQQQEQQQQPAIVAEVTTMPRTTITIAADAPSGINSNNNNHNNHSNSNSNSSNNTYTNNNNNTNSLKKKCSKVIPKRNELESKLIRTATTTATTTTTTPINNGDEKRRNMTTALASGGVDVYAGGADGRDKTLKSGVGGVAGGGQSSIKTSLSMTSLPPDDEKQERRDVIKAKLRVERPYNSLKKNADRSAMQLRYPTNFFGSPVGSGHNSAFGIGCAAGGGNNHHKNKNKYNRYSWGSNSSSSLHGSTGFGLSGKDDLWAAIQTNYNYIMDTNLLDTCREARGEIEDGTNVMESPIVGCFKLLVDDSQRSEDFIEDPKNLRRWLRQMEQKLEHSPTLSEATNFSIAELQHHLADHSVLYHEIVSHARVVSACIRAASERLQQQKQQQQQQQQIQREQIQQSPFDNISNAEQNYSSLSSTDTEQQKQQQLPQNPKFVTDDVEQSIEATTSTPLSSLSSTSSSLSTGGTTANTTIQSTTTTATATSTTTSAAAALKKSEGNLERLQNRYHLLYLKAFEVHLWLDGLLRKKTSNANAFNDDDDDDIDDDADSFSECDAIEDDLNDEDDDVAVSELESDATQNSSSVCDLLPHCNNENDEVDEIDNQITKISAHNNNNSKNNNNSHHLNNISTNKLHQLLQRDCIRGSKVDCDDGDDEEEEEDDDFNCGESSRYSPVVVTADGNTYDKSGNIGQVQLPTTTLTDFEADSESSDLETVNSVRRQRKFSAIDIRYAPQTLQKLPTHQIETTTHATATSAGAIDANGISLLKTPIATTTTKARTTRATSPTAPITSTPLHYTTTTAATESVANNFSFNLISINTNGINNDNTNNNRTNQNNNNSNNITCNNNNSNSNTNNDNNNHRNNRNSLATLNFIPNDVLLASDLLKAQQLLPPIESILSSNSFYRNSFAMQTKINGTNNVIDLGVDVGVGTNAMDQEKRKEMIQQQQHQQHEHHCYHEASVAETTQNSMITTTCTTATQTQQLLLQQMNLMSPTRENQTTQEEDQQQNNIQLLRTPQKTKNIAIISPNCHNNNTTTTNNNNTSTNSSNKNHNSNNNNLITNNTKISPPALRKRQQHQRNIVDISKFNRSNRKSKNCAIFYFKHLDTDNETNYDDDGGGCDDRDDDDDGDCVRDDHADNCGLSSSASNASDHLIKSPEASSDDDDDGGWLYSATLKTTADQPSSTPTTTTEFADNSFNCCVTNVIKTNRSEVVIQSSAISSSSLSSKSTKTALIEELKTNGITTNHSDKEAITTTANNLVGTTTTPVTPVATTTSEKSPKTVSADSNIKRTTSDCNLLIESSGGSFCSDANSISSCSSNDLLTETTATTTTTPTSQLTKIHLKNPATDMDAKSLQQNSAYINNSGGSGNNSDHHYNNNKNNNNVIGISNGLFLNGHSNVAKANASDNDDDGGSNGNDNANCLKQQNINESNCQMHFKNHIQRQHKQQPAQQQQQLIFVADSNGNMTIEQKCADFDEHLNGNRSSCCCCSHTRAADNNNTRIVKTNGILSNSCNNNNNHNNNNISRHQKQLQNPVKTLPPRSPAKSSTKSNKSTTSLVMNGGNMLTTMPSTKQLSHESIKQLVLEAEHLVRDEALKTPAKSKHSLIKISSTIKKREIIMPGPIKQRVQEWLQHQPNTPMQLNKPPPLPSTNNIVSSSIGTNDTIAINSRHNDDCEASGEASETDSVHHHPPGGSDTSDGQTESVATCMQTSTNSFGHSIERIGGSAEPIVGHGNVLGYGSSNQSLNATTVVKIVKRQQSRRKSERPWSVSCLSQLTTENAQVATKATEVSNVQAGLASHSISESALDSLSPGRRPRASSSTSVTHVRQQIVRNYDCKGGSSSLKRRKTRKTRKLSNVATHAATAVMSTSATYSAGKKISSDSGSEESTDLMPKLTQTMVMKSCETMSAQQIQEITNALLNLEKQSTIVETIGGCSAGGAVSGVTGVSMVAQTNSTVCASTHMKMQQQQQQQQQHYQHQHQQNHQQQQQQQQQQQLSQQASGSGGEEDDTPLMKPNFRVGSYTTAYMTSEARLGPLAALATYMNNDEEQQGAYTTGTEENHSSFSETAWDNYQEKYNSENYSEGLDSDAARRLLEFGDDYRNFIDSQSDCCSSLSAANNVDSLSPPRMDSLQQNEQKIISQETIVSSVDHARRRRALELEYERRRKNLEVRRKSCQDNSDNQQALSRSPTANSGNLSSSAHALISKTSTVENTVVLQHQHHRHNNINNNQDIKTITSSCRKLDFGMSHSAQSLRRTSESDTSTRRRKVDERRRSSRNLEKCIKLIPANTSSSSSDDSEDEKEVRNLLTQSQMRLEDTRSLKIRCHLLRPEDYNEIINTCRDNIRCLEAVLRGPPSTVLSASCASQSKDLLAAWEDLLGWSENAAAARKLQEEMIILKHTLHRLGNKSSFELLDTEPSIEIAIEALKDEKTQLQTYRTQMLRLNASVHSWLTRQERKLQTAVEEAAIAAAAAAATTVTVASATATSINTKVDNSVTSVINEMPEMAEHHQQQQNVAVDSTAFSVTAENNKTNPDINEINAVTNPSGDSSELLQATEKATQLDTLVHSESEFHKHLKDEVSDMYSAWDEADARIKSQLEMLTTSLIAWRQLECGLSEFHQVLGKDRGTLQGLEGALNEGHATPNELAHNVKLVAKLLSEKVSVSQEQLTAVQGNLDPNHIVHITKFTASNGSLSDSGISDGGATSDGGLSERERRLGVLRRLAKQLESALAPGSEAMKSIAARMESAEAELKHLQNTCRDLIVRTAATQQNKQKLLEAQQQNENELLLKQEQCVADNAAVVANENGESKSNGNMLSASSSNKISSRRNKRVTGSKEGNSNGCTHTNGPAGVTDNHKKLMKNRGSRSLPAATAPDGGDDPASDPDLEFELDKPDPDDDSEKRRRNGWAWRIAKAALPMQMALFTFLCAACLMQPNCCDNLNNFSMSFTPQLRYIRGPPPI